MMAFPHRCATCGAPWFIEHRCAGAGPGVNQAKPIDPRGTHAEKYFTDEGIDRIVAIAARTQVQPPMPDEEFEIRADGVRVRKDRWEYGIRRIVALLWGNRHEFEIDEVVEAVAKLVPAPFNDGDDEGLVRSVLGP